MKGDVFEILPNGERRHIGRIVSIEHGVPGLELTEVVVEIGRDSMTLETKHQEISMGCSLVGDDGTVHPAPPLEERLEAQGLPVPTREEKAAIYEASGLPHCDPNRVTEGFERAADLLQPLRDPTLEPLQRPAEPQ